MKDVSCPYCGHDQDINHDDGYGYNEEDTHQQQCSKCDKTFTYTTSIMYHYEVDQAICLNGGDHDWQPTKTFPKMYTKMFCTMCDEHRSPTEEEKIQLDIPSH